ncbi:MAG: hypothetical protein ACLRMZ_02980 [Blautia marasmi]
MRKRLKDSLWLQLIAFTALIMFLLLAAYTVTDSYSSRMLRDRTIDLNEKILLQVEGKMEDFHDTLNHVATAMAYAPTTYDYLPWTLLRESWRQKICRRFFPIRFCWRVT